VAQHAGLAHEGRRYFEGPRDAGLLLVERAGEGEQIVALAPQRDAHRADARASFGSRRSSSSAMKSNSSCRVARSGPASVSTSRLSHLVSVRTSRVSHCARVSVCRASANSLTSASSGPGWLAGWPAPPNWASSF
jgi:hypothetical protein